MNPIEALRMHGVGVGRKPTGNALSSDVRAGRTYSSAEGFDKEGTMPVRSLVAQMITPGVNNIIKQAGIYDGDITIEGDPDLVGANIISGRNIFGVAGTFDGKRTASGSATIQPASSRVFTITGLAFRPSKLRIFATAFNVVYFYWGGALDENSTSEPNYSNLIFNADGFSVAIATANNSGVQFSVGWEVIE